MKNRYLIVADDFTGSSDTGVQLCRRGYETRVLLGGRDAAVGETLGRRETSVVVDTESRAVSEQEARAIVGNAVGQVDFHAFHHVMKKVDSTLRGNIAAEVKALDEAFRPELILFAPALPDLGRTTVGGVQRLNGVEICRTELSKDPKNPVLEDDLARILEAAYVEPIKKTGLREIRGGALSLSEARIHVLDAETNEDMKISIRRALATGRRILWVGTAGLVDNLMEVEDAALPAFGVVASVSTVTNRQIRHCGQAGIALVQIPVHELIGGKSGGGEYSRRAIESLRQGRDTILLTTTSYDRSDIDLSERAAKEAGMDLPEAGEFTRSLMGRLAKEVLQSAKVSGVFVTGGDTALGLLRELQACGAKIRSEILTGIPMIELEGGDFAGMRMVTKAGAFGQEDAIAFAMRKIKEKRKENE